MFRLIILFVILTIWAIINIVSAKKRSGNVQTIDGGTDKKRGRKTAAGKKYSWAWMQAAGSMKLKFIRPEQSNGYPAINGTINGITVMVKCIPVSETADEHMLFSFHFPESAGIGLELKSAENEAGTNLDQNGAKLLAELLGTRSAGALSMQVSDPKTFAACMCSQNLDHIARLSLIYPKVVLSDSELQVCTKGINNDPQSLHDQLKTLLDIADAFAGFARHAAERKRMTLRVPQELIDAEKDICRPNPDSVKTGTVIPDPAMQEKAPETVMQEKKMMPEKEDNAGLPQDQSVFIRRLWQSGTSAVRQKELFAPYAGHEVEWEGILKMCYAYSSDFVFGKDGGIKATFELEEFKPEGSFMPIKVKAVAAFPKSEQEKLGKASGQKFRFRGKLLKIEPIAREIYISSGIITGVLS